MEASEFGAIIREYRKKANLTIRQLEATSGVSDSYLSNLENGKRGVPSPEILKKLTAGLNVSYEQLMLDAGYLKPVKLGPLPLIGKDPSSPVTRQVVRSIMERCEEIDRDHSEVAVMRCRISAATWQDLRFGRGELSEPYIELFAEALGLTVEELKSGKWDQGSSTSEEKEFIRLVKERLGTRFFVDWYRNTEDNRNRYIEGLKLLYQMEHGSK